MNNQHLRIVFLAIIASLARASTDTLDVTALQDLYKALNTSSQLEGWKTDGGDPCGEGWTGVFCSKSSVINLQLSRLNLSGYLGDQLQNLHNLKYLDVSFNNFMGGIPFGLPPNAYHINMAYNNLNQNIPVSLPMMNHLRYLNLSHNLLSGPLGNLFTGLQIKEMDLSYNNLTGELPCSFGSLTNLTKLFLQNNKFTGSVVYLADLPLTDLNIEDNGFSGVIPKQFQFIPNLWIWGNRFLVKANYPLWSFPLDSMSVEQNISGKATTQSSAIENIPTTVSTVEHEKKWLGPGKIACMVAGAALMATCVALVIAIRTNQTLAENLERFGGRNITQGSLPLSAAKDCSFVLEDSSQNVAVQTQPILRPISLYSSHPIRTEKRLKRKFLSSKRKFRGSAQVYTFAELELATCSFSEKNLLGDGSLGSVYRAELSDGQVLAVKNINMVSLSFYEEEQFMDVIRLASQMRHPNIVTLHGYCSENGHHLLVYEYIRNLTLDSALHSEACKALTWVHCLRIALGIARGLDYLHSSLSPVAHRNLKAANILLDKEFMPHIADCGLAVLRTLTSNSVKLKASEIAIGNTGYIAPDNDEPGSDNMKGDIYAFGVLLLEILSGKRPFDSSRPKEGQSLVSWAACQLHDKDRLEQIVDARIRKTIPSKALSNLADIISICIQPKKELRPPMSKIVNSLARLVRKLKIGGSRGAMDSNEVETTKGTSFYSTQAQFVGSPAMSSMSI